MTSEPQTPLFVSLFNLYVKVAEKVELLKESGKLVQIPYERIKAINLDFSFRDTTFKYDLDNIEYFDYYDWTTNVFVEFMDNEVKKLPEFEIAAEEIRAAHNMPEETKKYIKSVGLSSFVNLLMRKIPNEVINRENIGMYIDAYIEDCRAEATDNVFTWYVSAWLGNFHLESDSLQIGPYIIRKPSADELGVVRPRTHHFDEIERMTNRTLSSTAILEFSQRAKKPVGGLYGESIKADLERCLDVFRLFKVGNITISYLSVAPASVMAYPHSESHGSQFDSYSRSNVDFQHTSNYYYEVNKEEEAILRELFLVIKPILQSISPKNYFSGSYLDLAFHRYKDSLLQSEVNINRMVSAISCLEALLSTSQTEISYKISLHVAGLLKHFDFEPKGTFDKMRVAYNIRSRILHGTKLDSKDIKFSKEHTHEIVNYARLSLIIFLQLKDKISKEALVKKIDHALLASPEYKNLCDLMDRDVKKPVIYPFRKIINGDEFMNKKIVCIGWGSLIWRSENLKLKTKWFKDGPSLPIEFVRESSDKRITLVIDPESKPVQTLWAEMDANNIEIAVQSLVEREGSDKIEFVKATDSTDDLIKKAVRDWLQIKNLDVAIWTGLGFKFRNEKKRPSPEEVIAHLNTLKGDQKDQAEEYIRKAPMQIKTAYRKKIEAELGWAPIEKEEWYE